MIRCMGIPLVDDEVDEPTRTRMALEIRDVMARAQERSDDPLFRRLIAGMCDDICNAVATGGTRADIMERVSPILDDVGELETRFGPTREPDPADPP